MIAILNQRQWLDFESYRPLVTACAKRFLRSQSKCVLTVDDLMQEAWLAMYDASQHLPRIPEEKHTAYMARVIRYALLRRHQQSKPMDTGVTDCVADVDTAVDVELDMLTRDERRLLTAHLGLNGRAPQSLERLAIRWGVSKRTLQRRLRDCRLRIRSLDH